MAEQAQIPAKREDMAPRHRPVMDLFDALQDEMDRFWSAGLPALFRRPSAPMLARAPRMDLYEQENTLIVKAELPGLKKEDVQVELDDGSLVLRGESKSESEARDGHYYRMERSLGTFYRRVPLPFNVEAKQIQATLKDGVLEVRVPRPTDGTSKAQPIPVG